MYKRYSKVLKKTKEDSSSESESVEEQQPLKYPKEGKTRHGESSGEEDSLSASVSSASEESDGIIETGTLTVDELEAGDDAVARKPKRGEVLLYQCSICPEKELTTLTEVKVHIESKFHMKRYQLLVKRGLIKPEENADAAPEEDDAPQLPRKQASASPGKKSVASEKKDAKKKRVREETENLSDSSDESESAAPQSAKMDVTKPSKSDKKRELAPPMAKKQKSANGDAAPVEPSKPKPAVKKVESAEEKEARYAAKRDIKLKKRAERQETHSKEEKKKTPYTGPNKSPKSKDAPRPSKEQAKAPATPKSPKSGAPSAEKKKTPSKAPVDAASPSRKPKTPK